MSVDVEEDVEVGDASARSEHTISGEVYVFVREKKLTRWWRMDT